MFQQPRQATTRVVALRWFARGRVLVKDLSTGTTTTFHGLLPGEVASVRLPASGKLRDGRMIALESESRERAVPVCSHFDKCSGCALLHADESAQSHYLRSTLHEVLLRFADVVRNIDDIALVRSHRGDHRNRTRLLWRFDPGSRASQLGLRSRDGDEVVSLAACPANHQLLRLAVQALEDSAGDVLRSVGVHVSRAGAHNPLEHAVIELAIARDDVQDLLASPRMKQAVRITLNLKLHPQQSHRYHQPLQAALIDVLRKTMEIRGIEVGHHDAAGWSEANPGARKKLFEWVDRQLPPATRTLLDPTCAAGGISLALAIRRNHGFAVTASDRNWNAVQQAFETANAWNIPTSLNTRSQEPAHATKARYQLRGGDALTVMQNDLRAQKTYDAALINPMREPLGEPAMQALNHLVEKTIIYLAPAPQAGAKDVAILSAHHWRIASCAAIETHPWTARPMLALRLERDGPSGNSN